MSEESTARDLVILLRSRIANEMAPVHGYDEAANLLGLNGDRYARAMGQVCSRVDAASFFSGWPMLALHMVRQKDGSVNPESFRVGWDSWKDETIQTATCHLWTLAQVDEVIGALNGLPREGARRIWADILSREAAKAGFVRYNLHRKLKGTRV